MQGLLCYCRAGFEPELAAELTERAAEAGHGGYARTERNSGHVLFLADDGEALSEELPFAELIFARQKLVLIAELRGLDPKDRIAPMLDALAMFCGSDASRDSASEDAQAVRSRLASLLQKQAFGTLVVEHPDSDDAKPLAGLARSFGNALRPALRKAGLLSAQDNARLPRLHVCFIDGDHAFLATSDPRDSAPWPMGVPRLKMHADAPSRSALKLEEAILTLLTVDERAALLARRHARRRSRRRTRRLDLGADPAQAAGHRDRQRPAAPACDGHRPRAAPARRRFRLAPGKTAGLDGLRHGRAALARRRPHGRMVPRRLVPARDLQPQTADEEALAGNAAVPRTASKPQAGKPLTIRAKQLYHDREEITVFATPKR